MLLDRRTFILTASSLAATYSGFSLPLVRAAPLNVAARNLDSKEIKFRIEGWDFDANSSVVDEYVICVNQNWRCAWR
jgi:hypothetical protein